MKLVKDYVPESMADDTEQTDAGEKISVEIEGKKNHSERS